MATSGHDVKHKKGATCRKNIEGLAVHEMGYILKFFDCNTPEKLWRRAKDVDNC